MQPDLSKTQEDVQSLDDSVSSEIESLKSYDSELEDLLNGPSGVSYAQVQEYIEQAQSFDLQDFDDKLQALNVTNDEEDNLILTDEEDIFDL